MQIRIDIESTNVSSFVSKAGNTCFTQTAYVYLYDKQLNPEKYPRTLNIFCNKDGDKPHPYGVGEYTLSPDSYKVENDKLVITWLSLVPLKKSA
jgi:hypothetical protein